MLRVKEIKVHRKRKHTFNFHIECFSVALLFTYQYVFPHPSYVLSCIKSINSCPSTTGDEEVAMCPSRITWASPTTDWWHPHQLMEEGLHMLLLRLWP